MPVCFLDRGVSAVAAGEIASTDRFLTTVGMPQGAGNAIRLLLDFFEFDATLDDDAARFEMCGEHSFGSACDTNRMNGKRWSSRPMFPKSIVGRLTVIHMQELSRRRPTAAGELLAQTQRLENLQAPRLYRQRARLAGAIVSLVDNPEPHAKTCELACKCQPRRASAHHKDGDLVVGSAGITRHVGAHV